MAVRMPEDYERQERYFSECLYANLMSSHLYLQFLPQIGSIPPKNCHFTGDVGKSIMYTFFSIQKTLLIKLRHDFPKFVRSDSTLKAYLEEWIEIIRQSTDGSLKRVLLLSAVLLELALFLYSRGITEFLYSTPKYWHFMFKKICKETFYKNGGFEQLNTLSHTLVEDYDNIINEIYQKYWCQIPEEFETMTGIIANNLNSTRCLSSVVTDDTPPNLSIPEAIGSCAILSENHKVKTLPNLVKPAEIGVINNVFSLAAVTTFKSKDVKHLPKTEESSALEHKTKKLALRESVSKEKTKKVFIATRTSENSKIQLNRDKKRQVAVTTFKFKDIKHPLKPEKGSTIRHETKKLALRENVSQEKVKKLSIATSPSENTKIKLSLDEKCQSSMKAVVKTYAGAVKGQETPKSKSMSGMGSKENRADPVVTKQVTCQKVRISPVADRKYSKNINPNRSTSLPKNVSSGVSKSSKGLLFKIKKSSSHDRGQLSACVKASTEKRVPVTISLGGKLKRKLFVKNPEKVSAAIEKDKNVALRGGRKGHGHFPEALISSKTISFTDQSTSTSDISGISYDAPDCETTERGTFEKSIATLKLNNGLKTSDIEGHGTKSKGIETKSSTVLAEGKFSKILRKTYNKVKGAQSSMPSGSLGKVSSTTHGKLVKNIPKDTNIKKPWK